MLRIPQNRKEIFDKLASDVQSNLPNSNPQKEKSWLRSILASITNFFYDNYVQIKEAINTYFSNTTYDEFLEQKASNYGISRNPATISTGNIVFKGITDSIIPIGTILNGVSNSIQYKTLTTKTITDETLNVLQLNYSGGIATVIFNFDHDLVTDIDITIAGATPATLNGTIPVSSIIDAKTLQYKTTEAGSGTATGTITLDVSRAVVDVESLTAGEITNLNLNEQLTLLTPIVGVDNTAKVTFDEIGGGADIEDDESLRARLIFKQQNPVTLFNETQIELQARQFSFIERVFIFPITPDVGQVTIYLLKENNELPSATELQLVKDDIVNSILPVNTSPDDLFVLAPTPIDTDFDFTALDPNTPTMQTSIQNRLVEFFNEKTDVGVDITENEYICAIQSTIDIETGEAIKSFTLSVPTGDITINSGEIGILGSVTFV